MKQFMIILFVLLWSVVMLAAIGMLPGMLPNEQNNRMLSFSFGNGYEPAALLKEEAIPMDAVNKMEVIADSHKVEVIAIAGEELMIYQYGSARKPAEEWFTVDITGGQAQVSIPRVWRFGLFLSFGQEKLVLGIPQAWLGDLSLQVSSGTAKLIDRLHFQQLTIRASSGAVHIEKPLTCQSLQIGCTSGSIRLKANITAQQTMELSAHSGRITADETIQAPQITAKTTSGGIRLGTVIAEQYALAASSGSIRIDGVSGAGSFTATSGSISAALQNPVGDVTAKASSGSVRITVPPEVSFTFEGQTSSGGIHTDFETYYKDKRKKNAFATVGDDPRVTIRAEASSGGIHVTR